MYSICFMCFIGEMKNFKNEMISIKYEIMKAAKDRELGTQADDIYARYNRNKARETETDSSEIRNESINGRLGAEMKDDKKLNSCIVLENQIKANQIKENSEANQSKQNQIRKDIRKKQRLKKIEGKGKVT